MACDDRAAGRQGPIQSLATALFFAGLGLSAVLDTAWIGISLMVFGVLISISLLFVQWRKEASRNKCAVWRPVRGAKPCSC